MRSSAFRVAAASVGAGVSAVVYSRASSSRCDDATPAPNKQTPNKQMDIYGETWATMRSEFLPLQVAHPSWDLYGGRNYLRPTFERLPPSRSAGPDLRELAQKYFRWSRDGDEASSGPTPLGQEEPWPWVWSQKPSIGSVIVVVGSDKAAADALADACTSRDSTLVTVIGVGDEQALAAHGVGKGATQNAAIIDATVHSVDYEAKLLLTTPLPSNASQRRPLSDWHVDERLIFFDELRVV